MVESFDKRHVEWLVSDEEILLNDLSPEEFSTDEGDICSQVMKQCMDLDIPVLTLHDSFFDAEQHKGTVSKLVCEAFVDLVGVSCVVK